MIPTLVRHARLLLFLAFDGEGTRDCGCGNIANGPTNAGVCLDGFPTFYGTSERLERANVLIQGF